MANKKQSKDSNGSQDADIKALQKKMEALESIIVDVTEENDELRKQVAGVKKAAEEAPTAKKKKKKLPVPEKTFQVDKVKYRFRVARFRKGNKIIKAVDALDDRDLLVTIVNEHRPLVIEVEDK